MVSLWVAQFLLRSQLRKQPLREERMAGGKLGGRLLVGLGEVVVMGDMYDVQELIFVCCSILVVFLEFPHVVKVLHEYFKY